MSTSPTPFDTNGSLGSKRLIIRRDPDDPDPPELIEATWGSNLRFTDGIDYRFVRGDGQDFSIGNRCLIPATAFDMKVGEKRFRAALDSGNWFYLAGIWEPGDNGEVFYRIITVYANVDVVDYQQRHGAIIHRRQVYDWIDGLVPAADLLCMPPAHTFHVERIGGRKPRSQGQLAL